MPSWKKTRPKIRKHLGKKNPQVDVVDEWELFDIDRDEQKAGLKRRRNRWREVRKELALNKKAEKVAIKEAGKMGNSRNPNQIELAWLRCDYVLSNVMQLPAYNMMEYFRLNQTETYKKLYKIFMSKYMMQNIQYFVDYFSNGGSVKKKITLAMIYKEYKKLYGIKTKFTIKRKGEKDHEL